VSLPLSLSYAFSPRKIGSFVYKWTQPIIDDDHEASSSAASSSASSSPAATTAASAFASYADRFAVMEQLLHLDVTSLSLAPTHAAAVSASGQL
jgi:hypothetical protein